ncbi:helix-turn-helix domain-containing protein [Streptomyces sp. NPDC005125]
MPGTVAPVPGRGDQRKQQGSSLGEIATKTGIPKTSLHRYFTVQGADETSNGTR